MGYGKINNEGYLMSSQKKHDDTWHPLVNFEKDTNGEYFRWYIFDGTPNTAKIKAEDDAKALADAEKNIVNAVDSIVVEYRVGGTLYNFSGSLEAQNRLAVALLKSNGNAAKKQNWFTIDSQRVQLTNIDLTAILALVDEQMEIITAI